jgi:DNA repair exonuclease SbcCD ATPase subunit
MKIRELKLRNAFQHEKLDIEFSDFHAIIGANGSGKSNIVESIRYILTAKFLLPGTNDTMVREGAEKGHIDMTIESEGEMITTRAALGKASRSLKRGDEKKSKSAEVIEYIQNVLLRALPDAVNQSSIIAQGNLTAGLFDTQAKRTSVFMRLAGLSDIEKKREALQAEASKHTVPMLSFNIEELEIKIKELMDTRDILQKEIAGFKSYPTDKIAEARRLVMFTEETSESVKELKAVEESLQEFRGLRDEAQLSMDNLRAQSDAVGAKMASKEMLAKAQERITLYDANKKNWDKRKTLNTKMEQTAEQLEQLTATAPKAEYDGPSQEEMAELKAEAATMIASVDKTIAAFSGDDISECPICHTEHGIERAKEICEDANTTRADLVSVLSDAAAAYTEAVNAKAKWKRELDTYNTSRQVLQTRADTLLAEYDALAAGIEPKDPKDDRQLIITNDNLRTEQESVLEELTNITKAHSDAVVEVTKLENRQANLTLMAAAVIDPVKFKAAQDLIAASDKAAEAIAERNGRITGIENQINDEEVRLADALQQKQDAETVTRYVQFLEYARGSLHRDNFPSGKVKAFIDRMLLSANLYLDAMHAGFSISYDREMGFVAFFPQDNKSMRADRLSGGQKITFALAFRFAVNELHTDTGFLILDEPTVWLDDAHIDYMVKALSLVKSKLVPRTQVIVVTHDEKLAAICDGVSEIPVQ